jgi:SSS family solute:Na+ symporter
MFSTHPLDWGPIAAYVAFLGVVWLRDRRQPSGALDYLLAGRRITLPAFVATLVATWYGGILGIGEYTWRHGVSNWLVFGVPYYVGALLFALLFARRARAARLFTIPDLLAARHGRGPALMGALFVFLTSVPAAYVLMLGTLFSAMTGVSLVPCVIAAGALSLFYVDRGGLRTVVLTDQVQFVLMYAGFAILLAFLAAGHGALPFTAGALPASHFTWHGGNPPQAIWVWYFIALSALVDPGFWQRASAARDPVVARRGVLWSIVFWLVFDLMTTTAGLYARALLPGLADPVQAFPELGRLVLPPLALGVFFLGMIATVMSTIDSYGFIAASTIGRDFVWRLRGEANEERIPFYTRLGLGVACVAAVALALARPSVIALWHDIGSVTTPALLLPVGAALIGRAAIDPRWVTATMAAPFLVSLGWVIARIVSPAQVYPMSLEPIYPGLAMSVILFAAGWVVARKDPSRERS